MSKIAIFALCCLLGVAIVEAGGINKEEILKQFMVIADECRVEVGATAADIGNMIKKEPAAGREGKCLGACAMKKLKVMNANGKFDRAGAAEHSKIYTGGDPEKTKIALEITEACADITVPDDHCDAAAEYMKCLNEQDKKHGVDKFDM